MTLDRLVSQWPRWPVRMYPQELRSIGQYFYSLSPSLQFSLNPVWLAGSRNGFVATGGGYLAGSTLDSRAGLALSSQVKLQPTVNSQLWWATILLEPMFLPMSFFFLRRALSSPGSLLAQFFQGKSASTPPRILQCGLRHVRSDSGAGCWIWVLSNNCL